MGKLKSLKDLKSAIKPLPGQVWKLDDSNVQMDRENNGSDHDKSRYVLIVSSLGLINNNSTPSLNIIPLTNSAEASNIAIPIQKNYAEKSEDFKPTSNSHALLHLYQPIKKKHFNGWCGKLEENLYNGIRFALCKEIIGYSEYDLEAD